MRFLAEVIEIKAKKATSLDKIFRIVVETNDEGVVELQKYIASEPVVMSVESEGE